MTVKLLTPEDHYGLVSWQEGIDAMATAFREYGASKVRLSNPRTRTNIPNGFRMTVHQGVTPSLRAAVTSGRGELVQMLNDGKQRYRHRGRPVFILFDTDNAALQMIMIGEPKAPGLEAVEGIGGFQTACCAAFATDVVARPDAGKVGVLGSGGQAQLHLAGLAAARDITSVMIYSPNKEHRIAFAETMGKVIGCTVSTADHTDEVLESSEILLVCTNSNVPVFDGKLIRPGTHVTSIVHSNKELVEAGLLPRMRQEIDDETLKRSKVIVTTSRAQEELDRPAVLYGAAERGIIDWSQVLNVSDVLNDRNILEHAHQSHDITFLHNPAGWGIGAGAFVRRYFDKAVSVGIGKDLDISGEEITYGF